MTNKAELIEALEGRLGSRKAAAEALEAVLDTITRQVAKGEKVGITGFGTFEKANRAARTGRNPRTGEKVRIKKTSVPRFKAGTSFKAVVADPRKLPKAAPASKSTAATKTAAKTATKTAPARVATTKKTTASASGAAKKSTTRTAPATKTATTRASAAKKSISPARKAAATKVTRTSPARGTAAKKTTTRRTAS